MQQHSSFMFQLVNQLFSHKAFQRLLMFVVGVLVLVAEPELVIDGVTAATSAPSHPAPKLILTASPAAVNNTIRLKDEETVSITLSASDPNGYTTLKVGVVQNGTLYLSSNQSGLSLPAGATLTANSRDSSKATFTWTPPSGTSTSTPIVVLKFQAWNYHWNTKTSQTITFNIDDNLAPTFDEAAFPTQQSVKVNTPLKLPVTVNPDPDDDAVLVSASSLPTGAKLGKAAKKSGKWVSLMTWTPTLAQVGTNAVTFYATDDKTDPAQTSYPVDFEVGYVTAPSFDSTVLSAVTAKVKKKLSYNVIS